MNSSIDRDTIRPDYITRIVSLAQVTGKAFSFRYRQDHQCIIHRLEQGQRLLKQTQSFNPIQFQTIKEGYCYLISTPFLNDNDIPLINPEFLRNLAADIDFLHNNNLIHGDIRLANILNGDTGPKVIDFEPLLTIQRITSESRILKSRNLHPDDMESGQISFLSDRMGFGIVAQICQNYPQNKKSLVEDLREHCRALTCTEILDLPSLRQPTAINPYQAEQQLMNYVEML